MWSQDYKSLCSTVTICGPLLTSRHTDRQTDGYDQVMWTAQRLAWAKNIHCVSEKSSHLWTLCNFV